MTNDQDGREALGDFLLPQQMRPGWKAYEIVYTRYTCDPADPKGTLKGSAASYVTNPTDIEAFVRDRQAGAALPPPYMNRKRAGEDGWTEQAREIDIYVGRPCYVVIELDAGPGWQFKVGEPAITTFDDHFDDNGALRHLMPGGRILDHRGPDGEGCRIAFFGVNRRYMFEHQKFLCHIDFAKSLTQDPDPVTVDPDIPNDGGKFPFIGNRNRSSDTTTVCE